MSELKVSNYRIIDYEENYGAKLTYYGTIIGGKIIRKKRIKELFLKKIGMTFQEIVQQIDQIHISERISNLIKEQILHPIEELKIENRENVRCHHGALIPDENGKVKLEMFYPMNYFPEGADLTIHRLSTNMGMIIRDEFYNKIQLHELYPGTKIRWIESNNRETILTKNGMGNRFTIKTKIANLIYCTDRQYNYNIP